MRTNRLLPEGVYTVGGRVGDRATLLWQSHRQVWASCLVSEERAHTVDLFCFVFLFKIDVKWNIDKCIHSDLFLEESSNLCQPGLLLGGDELVFVPYLLAKGQCLLSCEHCVRQLSGSSLNPGPARHLLANMSKTQMRQVTAVKDVYTDGTKVLRSCYHVNTAASEH